MAVFLKFARVQTKHIYPFSAVAEHAVAENTFSSILKLSLFTFAAAVMKPVFFLIGVFFAYPATALGEPPLAWTQKQLTIMHDYKESSRVCARSPACRKILLYRAHHNQPNLQQMEVNLKLMQEELATIKTSNASLVTLELKR